MKLKPSTRLLLLITAYTRAAVRWTGVVLRTPSSRVAQAARQQVHDMITSARGCMEVWRMCNTPLEGTADS